MPTTTQETLTGWLAASPFQGYAYAYPHKTAYRPLRPVVPLQPLWAVEDRRHLFLYLHVPFCEMRCGFCNLFTTTNPEADLVGRWLEAMLRQARTVGEVLGAEARFARGAIGGGTPTFLSETELERLLSGMRAIFGASLTRTPFSVEMSPATVTAEKLALLRAFGMERASIGVQSFVASEVRSAGRGQRADEVDRALRLMAASGVPVRNLDLIYGIPGQTVATWRQSLEAAARYAPEEIYLYPLYVRPLTGLQRLQREPGDNREELYRAGRDWLLERGYRQISMRLFRAKHHPGVAEPGYVCQEDGMVGLGPGARSYTRQLHYSSDYAVERASIGQIIAAFVTRRAEDERCADYGAWLDRTEQQRRFIIKSLLRVEGLDAKAYQQRFGTEVLGDWPALTELGEHALADFTAESVRLTSEGLAWSDAIGPWLYSAEMRRQMADFSWS
jgi:oxygen-independent coproporphyrinogen-3 oxidase